MAQLIDKTFVRSHVRQSRTQDLTKQDSLSFGTASGCTPRTQVGKLGASRAVGQANGDNYLAIVVPCHRVIEANGNRRGSGDGLWRKQYLLNLERQSR